MQPFDEDCHVAPLLLLVALILSCAQGQFYFYMAMGTVTKNKQSCAIGHNRAQRHLFACHKANAKNSWHCWANKSEGPPKRPQAQSKSKAMELYPTCH